ncbi:MAG: hypothetical protein U0Q16_02830 [Bryobacteraceae bacterium]
MFIGHFAVALAARSAEPRASLGMLTLAAQWLDLIWPLFLLAGWEQVRVSPGDTAFTPLEFVSYPWTHSALVAVVWAGLFAVACWGFVRRTRVALITGGAVFSHWVLDWVTHRPDLPLYPGGALHGLGLWNSVPATVAIEIAMFVGAVALYRRARGRSKRVLPYAVFLGAIYLGNILGPPPPSPAAVAWASLALWVMPVWAWWIDREAARQ